MADPSRRAALRFVAVFVLTFTLFQLVFATTTSTETGFFRAYLELNASASAGLLRVLGFDVTSSGLTLSDAAQEVSVKRGCDAVQPMALLVCGILAFPASLPARLRGVAIGIAILFSLNLARIVTLFLCLLYWPAAFERLHGFLWPMAFLLVALGILISWAHRSLRFPAPPAASTG